MKQSILLFLLAIIGVNAKAEKAYVPIEVLTGGADLIVTGHITQVNAGTYLFEVTQTIKGKSTATITVKKFGEWMCDTRYTKHYVGEKLCLFLKQGAAGYEIICGSTGEKPIVNGKITPQYDYHKSMEAVYMMPVADFVKTITEFLKCYSFSGDLYIYDKQKFKQLVDNTTVQEFAKLNWLAKAMYDRMSSYKTVGK